MRSRVQIHVYYMLYVILVKYGFDSDQMLIIGICNKIFYHVICC